MKNSCGIEVRRFSETSRNSKESIWHAKGKKLELVSFKLDSESFVTELAPLLHVTPGQVHGSLLTSHDTSLRSLERLIMAEFCVGDNLEYAIFKKRKKRKKNNIKVVIFILAKVLEINWVNLEIC